MVNLSINNQPFLLVEDYDVSSIQTRMDTLETNMVCNFETYFENFLQTKYGIGLDTFEKILQTNAPEDFI